MLLLPLLCLLKVALTLLRPPPVLLLFKSTHDLRSQLLLLLLLPVEIGSRLCGKPQQAITTMLALLLLLLSSALVILIAWVRGLSCVSLVDNCLCSDTFKLIISLIRSGLETKLRLLGRGHDSTDIVLVLVCDLDTIPRRVMAGVVRDLSTTAFLFFTEDLVQEF